MLIIMAWLIMGLITLVGVFTIMFWGQWESLKGFLKHYYRHWKGWRDTILSIVTWPITLLELLNYVLVECDDSEEDLA